IKVNVEIQHYSDKTETIRYDEQANNDATVDLWLEVEEDTNIYEQIGETVRYTEDGAGEDYTVETIEEDGKKLKTVYTAVNPIFTNLSSESNYTVSALVDGTYNYNVSSVEKDEAASDEDTDVYNIRLIYDPDNFNLEYNIKMSDTMPEEAYPTSVTAKVTAYTEDGWSVIEQHSKAGVNIAIDPETGIGTGRYPVPISSGGEPVYYRIEIEGAVLHDGKTWVTASDVDNGHTEYTFGRYIGTVSAEDGTNAGGLDAVYYDAESDSQIGTLTARVSAQRYTVTYNSNGGSEVQSETQYRIPDLTDSKYIPEREEYTFMGWYTDEALTTPAVTDTPLEHDVTLYAKWKRTNLNISGTVTIDGVYVYDGKTVVIKEEDHPGSALVLLQEIEGDGYAATIDQVSVIFGEYENYEAKANYSFTAVNNEKDYRIAVLIPNYNETYQNADTAEGYNDTDYTAIFDNGSAEVNVYLDFVPVLYNQPYEIDTATLGSDYQPENAEIKILYDDKESGTNPQNWPVISQLEETNIPVEIRDGKGSGEYPVWIRHSKIEAEYDYAINILSFDDVPYDKVNMPFRIEYSGTARYSPLYGQPTETLTAVLRPKVYNITLDPNADGDEITGMDEYYFEDSEYDESGNEIDVAGYYMNHTWSFKTPINARPQRDGYIFKGWQYKDEIITEIPADICENIVLTAVWENAGMTAIRGADDVTVTLNEARQGVIAAAQYDADGVLLAVNTADTDTENTVYNIELSADDCAYIKVMLWDSLEAMTPIYNAVIK
ncbi:MAG: InlB B-repeat-containing protein, partial [Candidatus Ornithomonoglobus sp.]